MLNNCTTGCDPVSLFVYIGILRSSISWECIDNSANLGMNELDQMVLFENFNLTVLK